MQVNNIISNRNFGMEITAKEQFWATVDDEIWSKPKERNSKKLLKTVSKITKAPLKDTYEIRKIEIPYKEEIKNPICKMMKTFIKSGYQLYDKTAHRIVLERTSTQPEAKYFIPNVDPSDFVNYIAKN